MIDLDKLRESEGYILAIVNTKTGEYEPVSKEVQQVRHGKWIPSPTLDPRGFTDMFKCSECKRYSYYAYPVGRLDYKYCPHCGARMDEDNDG